MTGELLTGETLRKSLSDGKIFAAQTWSDDCVRSTSYDLRLASDLCIVPNGDGTSRIYVDQEMRTRPFVLDPGDSAVVSTMEEICLDWEIGGSIGTKFSLASRGVIVLTGLCVDPGFGYINDEDGDWDVLPGQRLHFVLFNAGPSRIVLSPGKEKIATIQFNTCEPPEEKTYTLSAGFGHLADEFFSSGGSSVGLSYFRSMREAQTVVLEQSDRLDEFEARVVTAEAAVNSSVVFGIYLVAIALLGIATTIGLGATASLDESALWWQLVAAVLSAGVLAITAVWSAVAVVGKITRPRR